MANTPPPHPTAEECFSPPVGGACQEWLLLFEVELPVEGLTFQIFSRFPHGRGKKRNLKIPMDKPRQAAGRKKYRSLQGGESALVKKFPFDPVIAGTKIIFMHKNPLILPVNINLPF
jgi:hypothetical protein